MREATSKPFLQASCASGKKAWGWLVKIWGWLLTIAAVASLLYYGKDILLWLRDPKNIDWIISWSNRPLFPWVGLALLIAISVWMIRHEAKKIKYLEEIRLDTQKRANGTTNKIIDERLDAQKHANGATNRIIDERLAKYDRKLELLFVHLAMNGVQMRQRERLEHFKERRERVVAKYSDYQSQPNPASRSDLIKRRDDLDGLSFNCAERFESIIPAGKIDPNIESAEISQAYEPPGYQVVHLRDRQIADAYRTCYAKLSKQIEVLEHADRLASAKLQQASKELFGANLVR